MSLESHINSNTILAMPYKFILLYTAVFLFCQPLSAQIEDVIVERYYISSESDKTDPFGAELATGSRTYRIFVDLEEGATLKRLFGDNDYPFIIRSTAEFFNHPFASNSFGYTVNSSLISGIASTLPLDSWLTIGFASDQNYGMLKAKDNDGTLYQPGYLENQDAKIGIPLTEADGLIPASTAVEVYNFTDIAPQNSIFGNETVGSEFNATSVIINTQTGFSGSGDNNQVLIAQLTTAGELSFSLNLVVEAAGELLYFTGKDSANQREGMIYSNKLSYPKKAGCMDPYYAEYDPSAVVDDGSCSTPIVLGCMDPNACNFDEKANFNVRELCCYGPDSCDNRDITVVCPLYAAGASLSSYPNPAIENMIVELYSPSESEGKLTIADFMGRTVFSADLRLTGGSYQKEINVSMLNKGIYSVIFQTESNVVSHKFLKN